MPAGSGDEASEVLQKPIEMLAIERNAQVARVLALEDRTEQSFCRRDLELQRDLGRLEGCHKKNK